MGSVRAVCNGKNHTREQYFLRTGKGDKGGKYIKKDEKHHMFVGQEVIFSFESAETPIDVKNIELLIQKFLM